VKKKGGVFTLLGKLKFKNFKRNFNLYKLLVCWVCVVGVFI